MQLGWEKCVRFEGKVAIITGAAGGIGSATARLMTSESGKVAAVDSDEAGLAALVAATGDHSGELTPLLADAFEPEAVRAAVGSVLERWGHIDVLVNCVGGSTVIPDRERPVEKLTLEEWKRLIDFNLDSAFLFCREVLPQMKRQHSGKIVNLSSRAATGLDGSPSAYSAAKAGIIAMTMRIAREAGPYGVNVNAVAPDTTLTQRVVDRVWNLKSPAEQQAYLESVALRRLGQPEDQARVIAFLASEDAGFITGQTIHVNGGM